MTIYPNMNKEDRNRILQSRYSLLGIPEQSSPDGRLLYIPDLVGSNPISSIIY